jgi:hypothetical protein
MNIQRIEHIGIVIDIANETLTNAKEYGFRLINEVSCKSAEGYD